MKETILKHKRWIILAIAIMVFVLIAEDVFEKELFSFDSIIYQFLVEHRNPFLTNLFKTVTHFGGAFVLITISILCMILIKRKKYKITILLHIL